MLQTWFNSIGVTRIILWLLDVIRKLLSTSKSRSFSDSLCQYYILSPYCELRHWVLWLEHTISESINLFLKAILLVRRQHQTHIHTSIYFELSWTKFINQFMSKCDKIWWPSIFPSIELFIFIIFYFSKEVQAIFWNKHK